MIDMIPLANLSKGCRGKVCQLMGCPEEVRRLEELGLRDGVEVEMIQNGCPCIIGLAGCRLCFRPNDAMGVMVHALQAS